jgi:hypothetical protein
MIVSTFGRSLPELLTIMKVAPAERTPRDWHGQPGHDAIERTVDGWQAEV